MRVSFGIIDCLGAMGLELRHDVIGKKIAEVTASCEVVCGVCAVCGVCVCVCLCVVVNAYVCMCVFFFPIVTHVMSV